MTIIFSTGIVKEKKLKKQIIISKIFVVELFLTRFLANILEANGIGTSIHR